MSTSCAGPRQRGLTRLLPVLLPLACLAWAYGSVLSDLAGTWRTNEQYSHGFLVVPFAVLLLWLRRGQLDRSALRPSAWGVILLLASLAVWLYGAWFHYVWFNSITLVPCVAGLCLALGGRAAWRWAWPSVLFLAFMVPLPFRVSDALSGPLQRIATVSSTFIMQVLGLPALAEGNIIQLNDAAIDVVEACSGLRMLVVFFALSAAVALVIRRPLTDRLIILASAAPIAVLSNIIRITVTGILHQAIDSDAANAFFHDVAGWLMMPLALAVLALELRLLSWLFIEPRARRPAAVPRPPAPRRSRLARPPRPGPAPGAA
jgi:exosortase